MRARSLAIFGCFGVLALLLQACFAPSYPTGIPCSELDTCPPDQFCVEGICRLDPGPGPGGDDASIPQQPDASGPGQPDASGPGQPDASNPQQPDASPTACAGPADCNDGVACTTDSCVGQRCVNAVDDAACDDGVACTADRCDAIEGCVAAPSDSACNDGVACTTDRCDAIEGCLSTPSDAACNDGIACTTERCDATQGCRVTPNDSACNDGVACTTDRCDAAQGCLAAPDDSACNDGVACTTDRCDATQGCLAAPDDGFCDDGEECTNDRCTQAAGCVREPIAFCVSECQVVLIYNDNPDNDLAARAVTALGMNAVVTTTTEEFTAAFDAGGFDLIIIDSANDGITSSVTSPLTSWLDNGQRLIFSYWNLDSDAGLKAALRVNTVRDLNSAPPVHRASGSPVDFFTLFDQFPSPLAFGDPVFFDNGDGLTLSAQGFVAARFADPASGDGAILVTRNDRVIVMGFLPSDIFLSDTDADEDAINDGEELYRNELRFLCEPAP